MRRGDDGGRASASFAGSGGGPTSVRSSVELDPERAVSGEGAAATPESGSGVNGSVPVEPFSTPGGGLSVSLAPVARASARGVEGGDMGRADRSGIVTP